MRKRANLFLLVGAVVALQALFPIASLAAAGGDPAEPARQAGEDRWVPSLAITGGATIQDQHGVADSVLFEDMSPTPVPLRGFVNGDDLAVSPFVGGSLEVMTPVLPIPTRPRLFLSGEILPTFASDRDVALEGDPGCVRGPLPDAPCARDIEEFGATTFGEDAINGEGTKTTAQVDTLVFGASLGVAFPLRFGRRQLRIKPSVGWINYKVEAEGLVVDGACDPPNGCTDTIIEFPPFPPIVNEGFLRETTLTAGDSQRFNGIGPGLDIEMDAGRFGPLGVSLFLGGRAYRILDDRTITFGTTEAFDDQLGTDVAVAGFEVEVDPWMYRAHVGIRFQWLGSPD
jgi:hypothetical protein